MHTFQYLTEKLLREAVPEKDLSSELNAVSELETFAFARGIPTEISLVQSNGDTLHEGLMLAAALEFATVPPYLVALWSIIDEKHAVASSIRAIVHEEMLHMALINNVLSAIGGKPSLSQIGAPTYPAPLPGNVHPELTLTLGGFTKDSIDMFLEIERPEKVVVVDGCLPPSVVEGDTTIGKFYEAVRLALHARNPTFSVKNQVSGPLAPMVIASWDDLEKAFQLILTQGEGSPGSPLDSGSDDLSHYYRFLEIKLGCRLEWDSTNKILRRGKPITSPSVYPVATPPAMGWGRASSRRIRELSRGFNILYSELLDELQLAWTTEGHRAFLKAMERMFGMRELARTMIREPGPGGYGHAPEFRYLSREDRL